MTPLAQLTVASVAFVGTHFLMSHPFRAALVSRMGEKGFLGAYTLVSFGTLGWMIWAGVHQDPASPLWDAGRAGAIVASLLVWLGAILFSGSHKGNPAMPSPDKPVGAVKDPWGVFRITRHPMMWGFGLWAIGHAIVNATPASLIISASIFVLAIGGSALQDMKKERLMGDVWRSWEGRTAFVPFARGVAWPGTTPFVAGTALFLVATWAHGALGYAPVSIWAF